MEELAGLDAAYAHATQEDHEELKEKMCVALSLEIEGLLASFFAHTLLVIRTQFERI